MVYFSAGRGMCILVLFFTIYCHRIWKKSAWNHISWGLVNNTIDKWKGQPRNLVKELLDAVMYSREDQRYKKCFPVIQERKTKVLVFLSLCNYMKLHL